MYDLELKSDQYHEKVLTTNSAAIKERLQDQFIQKWAKDIDISSKCQIYKIYKQNFGFENYFSILTKKNLETTY